MVRPAFSKWAQSKGGLYLYDKKKPTLATWQPYQVAIFDTIFPEGDGPLPYKRVLWSEPKKSGKTEDAAAAQEYCALFVEVPGEQYVIANDLHGAKDRTWKYLVGSLEKAALVPGSGIKSTDFKITGATIQLSNGATIKAIPSDPRGEAGANHSFVSIDEVWGFEYESQRTLLTEFGPVPTRENSMVFMTGYQGYEGQAKLWHDMIDAVVVGGVPVPGLEWIDDGTGKPACMHMGDTFLLWSHLPRQPWHTQKYLEGEKENYKGRMNEYRRVWYNFREKSAHAYLSQERWDACFDQTVRALGLGDSRPVVVGIDAASKRDCSAVEGCTWNEESRKTEHVFSRIWSPEEGQPIDLDETILETVLELAKHFNVVACYYDPSQMVSISARLVKAGINMVEFPQGSRRLESDTLLSDLVQGGNFAHYGDPELRQHAINAFAEESPKGLRIVKEKSSKKIDGCVALAMACYGVKEELVGGESSAMEVQENPFYRAMDVRKRKSVWG